MPRSSSSRRIEAGVAPKRFENSMSRTPNSRIASSVPGTSVLNGSRYEYDTIPGFAGSNTSAVAGPAHTILAAQTHAAQTKRRVRDTPGKEFIATQ